MAGSAEEVAHIDATIRSRWEIDAAIIIFGLNTFDQVSPVYIYIYVCMVGES